MAPSSIGRERFVPRTTGSGLDGVGVSVFNIVVSVVVVVLVLGYLELEVWFFLWLNTDTLGGLVDLVVFGLSL